MNRREFFKSLATAVAGFTILPPALTYTRAPWRKICDAGAGVWVPDHYIGDVNWINGLIAEELSKRSPYLSIVEGGKFPEGMGETIRHRWVKQ